jgi:hypothetical protein
MYEKNLDWMSLRKGLQVFESLLRLHERENLRFVRGSIWPEKCLDFSGALNE